jgi:glycosyltransferase involved in cell wall biosynthesis
MDKLSIIIPAYNEAQTIGKLVEKIVEARFPVDYEIILVDDHSQDRTHEIIRLLSEKDIAGRIHVLRNDQNRGKGYSILRGLEHAQGDIVVVQDADFEYDPSELPRLLEPLLKKETDVVYGSRFLGKGIPQGMAFPNFIANRFLTCVTNLLFGTHLTDMETCYKLIRRGLMAALKLSAQRFDFEPEITAKLAKKKAKILELPICYHGRTASEGKKIKARDFFIALKVLVTNYFFL